MMNVAPNLTELIGENVLLPYNFSVIIKKKIY